MRALLSLPVLFGVAAAREGCGAGRCASESVLLQRAVQWQREGDVDLREGDRCADYASWPDVDKGVTCNGCTALVLTAPYGGRCDKYCASFNHYCMGAAEESNDSCDIKAPKRCDEAIAGTSDMLCTCWQGNDAGNDAAEPAPAPRPSPTPVAPTPTVVAPTPAGQPVTLRVVSYNLFWWNAFGRHPWKGNHVTNNIKDALQADVLGLQECDDPALIQSRTGLVPASPFKGAQGVMVRPGTFSVGDTGSADLRAAGKWGTRYVTWAQLTHKATGRTFWHFNTHWCVHSGRGRTCNAGKRHAGARNMLQVIRDKAGSAPVLITGDFNALMGEPGPQHFLENGFALAVNHWVDAIFYSKEHWQKGWSGTGNSAKSDHDPVIAELTLK